VKDNINHNVSFGYTCNQPKCYKYQSICSSELAMHSKTLIQLLTENCCRLSLMIGEQM